MFRRSLLLLALLLCAFQRPLAAASASARPSHSVTDAPDKEPDGGAAADKDKVDDAAAEDADAEADDAALRAAEKRYLLLKRESRRKQQEARRNSGAPNGWLISTHIDLMSNLSNRYVPSGSFMGLDIEKALGQHSGLKLSWAGSTLGSEANNSYTGDPVTVWEASLQLRGYPLNRGYLNGFFAGIGVHYGEILYRGSSAYWDSSSFSYLYSYWHSYAHSLGIGPVIGYQWIIGRTIAITLETNYRYHWVQDDLGYYTYYYYGSPSTNGGTYNTSTLDFKSGVGWAF